MLVSRVSAGLALLYFLNPVLALLPAPKEVREGVEVVILAETFRFTFSEDASRYDYPEDLVNAISLVERQLAEDRFERLVPRRGEADRASLLLASTLSTLELHLSISPVLALHEEVNRPLDDQDESYQLTISMSSSNSAPPSDSTPPQIHFEDHFPSQISAQLLANSSLGLLRGLQTFVQLVYSVPNVDGPPTKYVTGVPLEISDYPSFKYRGFMLDTSRHFYPLLAIERTLEAMSMAKLNVFHWHVTDAQSWPLFVPEIPELSEKGAYSSEKVYSVADFQHIQDFAALRGISVLLEVDLPGHTASVAESFPELVACANTDPWIPFGNEPPTGQLRFGNGDVQRFSEKLVSSVSSRIASPYFSTGGDEINLPCYADDHQTNTSLHKLGMTIDEGLSKLVSGVHKVLQGKSKTPIVWEEMVLTHNITLLAETIVMVWISSEHVRSVLDNGFRVIHAASDFFYLDCGGGGWVGNRISNSWCDPFKTWQKIYSFDPFANVSDAQRHLILGGQSLLWSEQADPTNLDSMAWPRAAAAAEVFWTGPNLPDGTPRNAEEALPRLHEWRYRAVQRGINAVPLQPEWCALRPGKCQI